MIIRESFLFIREGILFIRESFLFNRESYALIRENNTFIRKLSFACVRWNFAFILDSFALICETNAIIREKKIKYFFHLRKWAWCGFYTFLTFWRSNWNDEFLKYSSRISMAIKMFLFLNHIMGHLDMLMSYFDLLHILPLKLIYPKVLTVFTHRTI